MTRKRAKRPGLMERVDRAREASSDLQVRTLLHELQIHSEEITVQNEQLIKAQAELEAVRDRYADLYDFAPIGYVSLDVRGVIRDINLAGTQLLGRQRGFLVNLPLAALVANGDRERLRTFVAQAANITTVAPSIEITIKAERDCTVCLIARPLTTAMDGDLIFIAMLDVTEPRRLEAERRAAYERDQAKAAELAKEVATRINAEERVKALLERLVDVQEQERRRLALNLHDHVGQQLTALRLSVDALKNVKVSSAEGRARLESIEAIVTQLDRDIDFIAWELRPAALDDVGLEAAVEQLLRQWSWTHGVLAEFHATPSDGSRLPSEVESHLYRIVQEALNNVSKHAAAHRVSVLLDRRSDEVRLIIEDDGRGFDLDQIRNDHDRGMGLAGMHERALSIGGHLECESAPGKGTALFVRVPLSAQRLAT